MDERLGDSVAELGVNQVNDVTITPRNPHILVVEDNPAQQSYLEEIITKLGYGCTCANTWEEGLACFEERRFACILIDLGLPDGNGLSLVSEFFRRDPCAVPIILTGDQTAETVVETMRAGAFDYLTKPVDGITLRQALARAIAHHAVVHERTELVRLLYEEREQLRARVDAATTDLREYASACENSNLRLRALLGLTRLSAYYYSEQVLLEKVFQEVAQLAIPLQAMVLCDVNRQKVAAVYYDSDGQLTYTEGGAENATAGYDSLLADADPEMLTRNWFERHGGRDISHLKGLVFPETLWNRKVCTLGFFVAKKYTPSETDNEFLGMCARLLAFEWEQWNLLLYIAHQASLGNIATELVRNFIQPLTAVKSVGEVIRESSRSADVKRGADIISENVERLRLQTQEFRRLSILRADSVETVRLQDYVEQALQILSGAIRDKNVTVHQEFEGDFECVLLNGTALARTFLDLLIGALRAVDTGGFICIRLKKVDSERLAFELAYSGSEAGFMGVGKIPDNDEITHANGHPAVQLAERTVHMCGGRLSIGYDDEGRTTLQILLPANATDPSKGKLARW